jgi:hypothetical protein
MVSFIASYFASPAPCFRSIKDGKCAGCVGHDDCKIECNVDTAFR